MSAPRLGQCDRCAEPAVCFNDDGEALCEDCLFSDAIDESIGDIIAGKPTKYTPSDAGGE